MNGKSIMDIIHEISSDEARTLGCLETLLGEAGIKRWTISPEDNAWLIEEFENITTNLRRKWFIASLILNTHVHLAEPFFDKHHAYDKDGNGIFIERSD